MAAVNEKVLLAGGAVVLAGGIYLYEKKEKAATSTPTTGTSTYYNNLPQIPQNNPGTGAAPIGGPVVFETPLGYNPNTPYVEAYR
jgi:hypothetical protein